MTMLTDLTDYAIAAHYLRTHPGTPPTARSLISSITTWLAEQGLAHRDAYLIALEAPKALTAMTPRTTAPRPAPGPPPIGPPSTAYLPDPIPSPADIASMDMQSWAAHRRRIMAAYGIGDDLNGNGLQQYTAHAAPDTGSSVL
jgi:hypothetical protein